MRWEFWGLGIQGGVEAGVVHWTLISLSIWLNITCKVPQMVTCEFHHSLIQYRDKQYTAYAISGICTHGHQLSTASSARAEYITIVTAIIPKIILKFVASRKRPRRHLCCLVHCKSQRKRRRRSWGSSRFLTGWRLQLTIC